ncbi:MAG: RNA methyltransferase [Thermoplasmata archaeon]|nr:MAG: RNA methyltransferase [Thermoplasmata archaeon]
MELSVILVEPKYAGNTGSVARVMKNFGFHTIILVNPAFSIDDDECRKFAMHAQDVLDDAEVVSCFDEVVEMVDYLAGTTSIESRDDRHHLRKAMTARTFAEEAGKLEGTVGVAFGREDYGLFNEEIKKCDVLVKIPTSDAYPSMNLSHAVCAVLYEMFASLHEPDEFILASGNERQKLYEFFDELLDVTRYPSFKKEKASILFRRIIGRAMLSKWEYHTFMGVLKRAIQASRYRKEE